MTNAATADVAIRRLDGDEAAAAIDALSVVLLDCVEGGASVSFMADITRHDADAFWTDVAASVAVGRSILLVAETGDDAGGATIVGTVQVHPAWQPNQPHRADIAKLLVHRAVRGRGVAAALMRQAETEAAAAGRWLLTLDTIPAAAGYRLYQRLGWQEAGTIPDYALMPDGRLSDTVVFWKRLAPAQPPA